MDPRTAGSVLLKIASFLELRGESEFKVRAYARAARALGEVAGDDLGALDQAGSLAKVRGLGPATLAVVRDLIATGQSTLLEQLEAETPAGLLELLKVPGLGTSRIRVLHTSLGIDSVDSLERAARDGRLAGLNGIGPKTTAKLLQSIELYRASGSRLLYHRAQTAAAALLATVVAHPAVSRAAVAGSVRRHFETSGDVDIVAACTGDPVTTAGSFAQAPGVQHVAREGTASPGIRYVDGARLDLFCVPDANFTVALWRATGSDAHVSAVSRRLHERGFTLDGDTSHDVRGTTIAIVGEARIYDLAGLPYIPPEMREEGYELVLAGKGPMPTLLTAGDIRGSLHCHTTYSDGKASVEQMADAARAIGWSYIGITDHSQGAFYAGGMSRERVAAQLSEIDRLNETYADFRILKGIECDIMADGSLDYDAQTLDQFDFVVGSIHSRFTMDADAITGRVLKALDDPRLTILGHPTGRLLLSRRPAPIDMEVVLEKAGALGVAIELNADPKRLDIDWRLIPRAVECGALIAIGPDAHSTAGLNNVSIGVAMARKAGVEAMNVLNTLDAEEVLAFAASRRGNS